MTALREIRRYWRSNRLSTALVSLMLAFGFSGSAVTLVLMLALSSPRPAGLPAIPFATVTEETAGGGSRPFPWTVYEQVRDSTSSTALSMAAYAEPTQAKMSYQNTTNDISVAGISEGFFSRAVTGFFGEDFSSSWEGDSGVGEIILSASLQEKLFSSPSYALGRDVSLNGQTYHVVGVAPKALTGLWYPADAWVPPDRVFSLAFGMPNDQKPQGTVASPDAQKLWKKSPVFYALAFSAHSSEKGLLQSLSSAVRLPQNSAYHLHVTEGLTKDPARDQKIRTWSRLSFLLALALIFVAGFNYCGLLVAQVPRRMAELRLKKALGASVLRIMIENCYGPGFTVLSGFALACVMAVAGAWILKTQVGSYMELRITWLALAEVLGLGLVLALILAAIIALVPALRLSGDSGTPKLGYTTTSGKRAVFTLQAIVAVQIAFCILVGFSATMIFSTIRSTSRSALGFSSDQLTIVPIGLSSQAGNLDFRTSSTHEFPMEIFTREVLQHASETIPAMHSIAAASCAPFGRPMKMLKVSPLDGVSSSPQAVHFCGATQGFFETLENPIVEGRGFSGNALTGTVSEVVVNRKLAQELWPGTSPLHHTVKIEQSDFGMEFSAEVVGVAQDMRMAGKTTTPDAAVYLPLKSEVFALSFPLYFLVKGQASPHTLEMMTDQQAGLYTPGLIANAPYLAGERLRSSAFEQNMRIYLAVGAATLMSLIAFIGLYGALIYFTNSRRKEIALRMCFGASKWNVRKSIIRPAIQCALIAAFLALLGWRALAQFGAAEWMGQSPWSASMLLLVPIACVVAAILISLVPANAAAGVAPGEILKEQ